MIEVHSPYVHQLKRIASIAFVSTGIVALVGMIVFQAGILQKTADAAPTAEMYFTFDAGTGTITDYDDAGPTSIEIPETIGGVEVEAIGPSAFSDKNLVAVVFPETLTEIGPGAFTYNEIIDLTLPESLTVLGPSAFDNNPLETVQIGVIGSGATPVLDIDNGAFSNLSTLEHVKLGDSVLAVTEGSFANATGITDLDLGEKVQTISGSFSNLSSLEFLFIPNSVTTIFSSFSSMTAVKEMYVGTTDYVGAPILTVSGGSFSGLSALESLTFGNTIDTITGGSFYGFMVLGSLDLGTAIQEISGGSLSVGLGGTLTELTIPDSLAGLGGGIFAGSSIETLIIGTDSYTGPAHMVITDGAFSNSQVDTLDIKGTALLSIANGAFSSTKLTELVIPDSVTTIGDGVFSGNPLMSVVIGDGVTSIGNGAFAGTPIESLVLGESLATIGSSAFAGARITDLTVKSDIKTYLTDGTFGGSNQNTGEYIRLYTDADNTYNYEDILSGGYAYLVNPAQLSTAYLNANNAELQTPSLIYGTTRTDYTLVEDEVLPITGFLRAGQTVTVNAPAIGGYTTPASKNVTLVARANDVTFIYNVAAEETPAGGSNNGDSQSGGSTTNNGSQSNGGGATVTTTEDETKTEEETVTDSPNATPITTTDDAADDVAETTGSILPVVGAAAAGVGLVAGAGVLLARRFRQPSDL